MKKDHLAEKEHRYGCSVECGGTPLRVYARELGSDDPWTSVEDYLQVGHALGYGENWQYSYSGGELLMMGQGGEPNQYYPHDDNGMNITPAAQVCACFVQPTQSVCAPLGYGGCEGGQCEEMPPILSPFPFPSQEPSDSGYSLHGVGIIIGVIGGLAGGSLYVGGCIGALWGAGQGTSEACKRMGYKKCDKLAHCVAACVARKCGTRLLSWCLGWAKELIGKKSISPEDLAANHQGEKCAVSGKGLEHCATCCIKWWVWRWPQPTK